MKTPEAETELPPGDMCDVLPAVAVALFFWAALLGRICSVCSGEAELKRPAANSACEIRPGLTAAPSADRLPAGSCRPAGGRLSAE